MQLNSRSVSNKIKGTPSMRINKNPFGFDVKRWLRQGISPGRLALTLALGFAIGCIPIVGVTTVLCATLALTLRLNQPAIQAANYAAMPLQLILIVPFMRLGKWGLGSVHVHLLDWLRNAVILGPVARLGWLAGQALFGWMLVAGPAVMLLWLMLTPMLRRIPAIASAECGD
jgi:uncharacterized protein (DUF2062 family)